MSANADDVLRALVDSTERAIGDSRLVAVAYSSGLDSSIIAYLACRFASVSAYTCAIEGSHDAAVAPAKGAEQGFITKLFLLDERELLRAMALASRALRSLDPMTIAYTVPIIVVLERSKEDAVLVGTGADELFGGYAKYLSASDPEKMMALDEEKMIRELGLLKEAAAGLGKRLEAPYVTAQVIEIAHRLPLDAKLGGGIRKKILREIASKLGLPAPETPKKAAQYSSGVLREMRKLARKSGLTLTGWTRSVCSPQENWR